MAKKKIDYEALNCRMMQIPEMDIASARDLLDMGITDIFQLQGRSPESLFNDLKKIRPVPDPKRLCYFRLAVYFAENKDNLDPSKCNPWAWRDVTY